MTLRHYDVVVIGRGLGCLAAAALLARRDFSVLLLGHRALPAAYAWGEHRLARRSRGLHFAETPAWRALLRDLAQTQTFRRRSRDLAPSFSLLLARQRLQLSKTRAACSAEVRRELPEVHPVVEELWANLARCHEALDHELSRHRPWPPEGMVDRLRARSWVPSLPLAGHSAGDLLDKLPRDHPYREVAFLPAAFASDWACSVEELPAVAAARLQHQWVHHARVFEGDIGGLDDFLIERAQAHGGACELRERAEGLTFLRGRVSGVVCGGGDRVVGADFVVTDLSARELAGLSRGQISSSPETREPGVLPEQGRFIVNCIVSPRGLPQALAREAFVAGRPADEIPDLHLTRVPTSRPEEELLVAERLCALGGGRRLSRARSTVMAALRRQFPFLDRHLRVVDSPHDGLPLQVWEAGQPRSIDRARMAGASRRAEPMEQRFSRPDEAFLGLCGESYRGPVRGTFLAGKTVFPGLGSEGELLAAWSAAGRITRADRAWQKRRRQMWSKIDTD